MKVFYHPRFRHSYKSLSLDLQRKAEQKERFFRVNPFDPRLDTHKLHGKLKHLWSFSVDRKNRIVFELLGGSKAVFLDIGDHDIYR